MTKLVMSNFIGCLICTKGHNLAHKDVFTRKIMYPQQDDLYIKSVKYVLFTVKECK